MLLVVTGLRAEAKAAAPLVRGGGRIVATAGDPARVRAALDRAFADGADAVLSFGLAAGLAPELAAGTLLIPGEVVSDDGAMRFVVDADWVVRLSGVLPAADRRPLCGVTSVIASIEEKTALRARSGAVAADMESLAVAQECAAAGRRFAVLRAVCDPAASPLPPAARQAMRADGRIDLKAVLGSLARQPGQIPALLRLAADARTAIAALRKAALVAKLLGGGAGGANGGGSLDRA